MRPDRRSMLGGGVAAALLPGDAIATTRLARRRSDGLYATPPEGLIVDFRRWLPDPVKLRSADAVKIGRHQFVRVVSEDGIEGVVKANSRMEEVTSLFHLVVKPKFMGRDVRDLQAIVEDVYRRDYKFAGLAFWTAVGHLELAVWDLLGKTAGVRCVDFMGPVLRTEIPIYVSSLDRGTTPEQEVAWIAEAVARTGARAAKIKVGGRMSLGEDARPGRSEGVVAAMRKAFGDDFTIYADANGSYDAPSAIALCRMLQDYGVAVLEEPCPFEDFEMTKQVADRVRLPIAGGEQDGSMEMWRWYIERRGLDVLQPDFMYNGGMLRTLMVQRMAHAAGVGVAPHYPRNGVETVELLHFAARAPNLYGFQEYRGKPRTLDFGHEPVIEPRGGVLALPPGPGFGARFDPALWSKAEPL